MSLKIEKKNKPAKELGAKGRIIFGLIMIALGTAIFIFASLPKLQKAKETRTWSKTEGEIIEVQMVAHHNGHDEVLGRKNPERYMNDENVKFRIETRYTYQVNDAAYSSKKRHLMQQKSDGDSKYRRAELRKNYYMNHRDVTVYYNPEDPNEALLRVGLRPGSWLLVVSPLFMALIGVLLLLSVFRSKLRK